MGLFRRGESDDLGGFLNGSDGTGVCHHAGLTQQGDWYPQPIVVNLSTGSVVRRLSVLRNRMGGIAGFQVDASGHYLAFIGKGIGGGLYRCVISGNTPRATGEPVLVKDRVGSAAWIPHS